MALERKLEGRGLSFVPGKFSEDCLYIKNIASMDSLDLYQKGLLTVQGEASMLVGRAVCARPGERILDACAAPGGKTAYLAQEAPAELLAWDVHAHRVELMRENRRRPGVRADTEAQDAAVPRKDLREQFDAVLVDAPCSALGLLYRKPDIKFSKTDADLAALVGMQRRILSACADYVKPGGRLVYSTCTIHQRENIDNVRWFLREHPDFSADTQDLAAHWPEALLGARAGGEFAVVPAFGRDRRIFYRLYEEENMSVEKKALLDFSLEELRTELAAMGEKPFGPRRYINGCSNVARFPR